MKRFINRALEKVDKIEKEQLVKLLRAVAEEYQLLETVYDSMTDGVIVVGEDFFIEFINKSAERYIPVDNRLIAHRPVWDVIRDQQISRFIHETINSEENAQDREFSLQTAKGKRIISISLMPLVKEGNIRGTILHLEDVTGKREQAARLSRAERLASLTTLTASVAHEIKNPLAAISIHIQLMQKSMKKKCCDQEFIAKHLEVVNDEVERLNGTIVDFLFAVRPMDMHPEMQDLNHLLADLVELVEVELIESGISWRFLPGENLPAVSIDEKYLKQAFLNIIKNAMAAMDGQADAKLVIKSYREDNDLVVEFDDNGCGIPEDLMNKIFEPYFTTKDFGSGLGLTVVYKVIQEHRGELVVDSNEGKGTRFTIRIPIETGKTALLGWDRD